MSSIQTYKASLHTVTYSENSTMTTELSTAATENSPISESLASALRIATTATTTANDTTDRNGLASEAQQEQQVSTATTMSTAKKRSQVRNACTNCQKACKKCADERPCPRCVRYNIAATCVNSIRKERQKGIKRGPYKRKSKVEEKKSDGNKHIPTPIAPASTDAAAAPVNQESSTKDPPISVVSNAVISATEATVPTAAAIAVESTRIDYGYPPQLSQYPQGYPLYYSMKLSMSSTPSEETKETNRQEDNGSHIMTVPYALPNNYSQYPAPIVVDNSSIEQSKDSNVNTQESIVATAEEMSRKIEQFARLSELCSAALREKEQQKKQQQGTAEDSNTNNLITNNEGNEAPAIKMEE